MIAFRGQKKVGPHRLVSAPIIWESPPAEPNRRNFVTLTDHHHSQPYCFYIIPRSGQKTCQILYTPLSIWFVLLDVISENEVKPTLSSFHSSFHIFLSRTDGCFWIFLNGCYFHDWIVTLEFRSLRAINDY